MDLLNTRCDCGRGVYRRTEVSLLHRDSPNLLRCTACLVPVSRYYYPALAKLRQRKYTEEPVAPIPKKKRKWYE